MSEAPDGSAPATVATAASVETLGRRSLRWTLPPPKTPAATTQHLALLTLWKASSRSWPHQTLERDDDDNDDETDA
jgi:hypothetical protein